MSIATLIDRFGVAVSHGTSSKSTDDVGGTIESWSYAVGDTALVQIDGGGDSVVGGRENRSRSATFYFPASKSIDVDDRLVVNSATFEERSVKTPHQRPTTDSLAYVIVKADQVLS